MAEDELEFETPLEEEVEEIDVQAGRNKIFTDQGDPEIESLYNKWKRGKLVIQPDFQRQFVWDSKKSSRLIESALLDQSVRPEREVRFSSNNECGVAGTLN